MSVKSLLQTKWHALNPFYKKYCQVGCLVLLAIFLMSAFFVSLSQVLTIEKSRFQLEDKRTVFLTEQINSLRAQVEKLASTQDSAPVKKLSDELGVIEKDVSGVAKSAELEKIAVEMETHLDEMEKMIVSTSTNKKYLDAKLLPFQVTSVDVISQQPFVSVNYNHQMMPLGVGDSLAGWKILNADYAAMEVEFENDQGQFVKVRVLDKIEISGEA